jgi:hypothetical protein
VVNCIALNFGGFSGVTTISQGHIEHWASVDSVLNSKIRKGEVETQSFKISVDSCALLNFFTVIYLHQKRVKFIKQVVIDLPGIRFHNQAAETPVTQS